MRSRSRLVWRFGLLALVAGTPVAALQMDKGGELGIPYATGGVGYEEREQLNAAAQNYNLKLIFAAVGDTAFVADVVVRIYDDSGREILQATSDGPWFFAKLPPGKYRVTATAAGSTQERTVTVTGDRIVQTGFYWRTS